MSLSRRNFTGIISVLNTLNGPCTILFCEINLP